MHWKIKSSDSELEIMSDDIKYYIDRGNNSIDNERK